MKDQAQSLPPIPLRSPLSRGLEPNGSAAVYAAISALLVSGAVGCANVDPAPEDLDGLIHFFWNSYQEGEDAQIREAVSNLHATTRADELEEARDGSFSDLAASEVAVVGLEGKVDPSAARGMFLVNVIACPLESVERIVYALEQDQLYEDVYDRYERRYTSDLDAYVSRDRRSLTWEVDIAASVLGTSYEEHLKGGIRWVPAGEPGSQFGPILVARTWMPEPARFESDSKSFDQDYQIEVYYERAPGEVVHLYGMWRQMDMGTILNLTQDNDQLVATILGNLADWDEQTGKLCKEGRP